MSAELVTEFDAAHRTRAHATRARVVAWLGPAAAAAGVVWALVQPYRLTILHPHHQGFWWLAVEPPLLVIGAGLLFHLLVAPGVIDDLDGEG